jgi:hypothetical protein
MGLIDAWQFRILLLLAALTGFLGSFVEYEDYHAFQVGSRIAKAIPASKWEVPGHKMVIEGQEKTQFALKFNTDKNDQLFISPYLPKPLLDQLNRDGYIEIAYRVDDPQRFIFKGEQLPTGRFWLFFGIVSSGLFAISLRLR